MNFVFDTGFYSSEKLQILYELWLVLDEMHRPLKLEHENTAYVSLAE